MRKLDQEETINYVNNFPEAKVKLAICDIDGILRGKVIHRDKFNAIIDKGFGFCNVVFGWDAGDEAYDNTKFTGWHSGYPDTNARIDLNTFRKIPWEWDVPFFLADFCDEKGNPTSVCPRNLLKNISKKSMKMGYSPVFSQEFEWLNFQETPQS